jgi:predicted nuclease of predicted toxin-antitoxin system
MSVQLYMDVHVPRAITNQLRLHGVDVLTAQEDGAAELRDSALLDRATQLGRVLYSQDEDLLVEACDRQRRHQPFAGVVYAHQLKITIGQAIADLLLVAEVGEPADFENMVRYLPL